jgi:hypothetical protein
MYVGLRKEGCELVWEHRLLNDVPHPTVQSVYIDKHCKCKENTKNTVLQKLKLIKISVDFYQEKLIFWILLKSLLYTFHDVFTSFFACTSNKK